MFYVSADCTDGSFSLAEINNFSQILCGKWNCYTEALWAEHKYLIIPKKLTEFCFFANFFRLNATEVNIFIPVDQKI